MPAASAAEVALLITTSIDYVSDLLVVRLGGEKVFRFNKELIGASTIYAALCGLSGDLSPS